MERETILALGVASHHASVRALPVEVAISLGVTMVPTTALPSRSVSGSPGTETLASAIDNGASPTPTQEGDGGLAPFDKAIS